MAVDRSRLPCVLSPCCSNETTPPRQPLREGAARASSRWPERERPERLASRRASVRNFVFQGDCKTFFPLLLVRPSVVGAPALFSAVMRFSSMPAQAAAESINRANSAARTHNFLSVSDLCCLPPPLQHLHYAGYCYPLRRRGARRPRVQDRVHLLGHARVSPLSILFLSNASSSGGEGPRAREEGKKELAINLVGGDGKTKAHFPHALSPSLPPSLPRINFLPQLAAG